MTAATIAMSTRRRRLGRGGRAAMGLGMGMGCGRGAGLDGRAGSLQGLPEARTQPIERRVVIFTT
jgi:hypothetical protein